MLETKLMSPWMIPKQANYQQRLVRKCEESFNGDSPWRLVKAITLCFATLNAYLIITYTRSFTNGFKPTVLLL